jgi:malonyl-CoA decarboxylase
MPGFAAWLLGGPDLQALPRIGAGAAAALEAARRRLLKATAGDLGALNGASVHDKLDADDEAALRALAAGYLLHLSGARGGDPVARFHLDNGARLERLNLRANLSPRGLKQSFGLMVNYLYDLPRVEANHARFRRGEVAHARDVAIPVS